MGTIVTSIEGQGGADDTVKVVKDGTETIFESVEDAAQFIGEDAEWLESKLDDAGYGEDVDIDAAKDEEEDENEEEGEEEGSGEGGTAA